MSLSLFEFIKLTFSFGTIKSFTFVLLYFKAFINISFSNLSITPCSFPSCIIIFISLSVNCSFVSSILNILQIIFDEYVAILSNGYVINDNAYNIFINLNIVFSGESLAIFLGSKAPNTNKKYDNIIVTIITANIFDAQIVNPKFSKFNFKSLYF